MKKQCIPLPEDRSELLYHSFFRQAREKFTTEQIHVFVEFCSFIDISGFNVIQYRYMTFDLREVSVMGKEDGKKRRVMLKLSGEALAGEKKTGFDEATVKDVARQVKLSVDKGVQVSIVIGGGNFWRGRSSNAIDRTKADQIGMLATVMNCIYVSEIFRSTGMKTRVFTPFLCGAFTELFSKDAANRALEDGEVVFYAGGTGHPYFSTDTGVVLRAVEMEADVILLAKAIDGVYDSDPAKNPDAVKYDEISIQDVVDNRLGVIDLTASIMCLENHMPLAVFGLKGENSIAKALDGEMNGTYVRA